MAKVFPRTPTTGGDNMARKPRAAALPFFREPTPEQRRKMAADHFAETVVDTDPARTREKQRIAADALRLANKAGGGGKGKKRA